MATAPELGSSVSGTGFGLAARWCRAHLGALRDPEGLRVERGAESLRALQRLWGGASRGNFLCSRRATAPQLGSIGRAQRLGAPGAAPALAPPAPHPSRGPPRRGPGRRRSSGAEATGRARGARGASLVAGGAVLGVVEQRAALVQRLGAGRGVGGNGEDSQWIRGGLLRAGPQVDRARGLGQSAETLRRVAGTKGNEAKGVGKTQVLLDRWSLHILGIRIRHVGPLIN